MKTLFCRGYITKKYPIYFSSLETFEDFFSLLPASQKKIIVIDRKIINLFPNLINALKRENVFIFPIIATESNKTFEGLEKLAKGIFSTKPSKDDILIAIGGGLILNLGGLTASLVMRGIPFYYVPTTLTAQIDVCFGSKQAVNFMGAKNWIGLYNDPEFCYVNPNFLKTIPRKEIDSQAIEGIKLCLATNRELFFEYFETLNHFGSQPFAALKSFVEKMILLKVSILQNQDIHAVYLESFPLF